MPSKVKIGPVVLEKKSEIGKVYRQTDGQTDNERQAIRKAHLSFQLRLAKIGRQTLIDIPCQQTAIYQNMVVKA